MPLTKPHALLEPLLVRLHGKGRLRVGSLLISIFGDLIQPRKQTISVQELLSLTGHVGIEENAVRTALSRLSKEGWVERHKDGRQAFYALSDAGKTTFLAPTERIYSHSFVSKSARWNLGYFENPVSYAKGEIPAGFTLSKHWQLINDEDVHRFANDNIMMLPTHAVDAPTWVLERLMPDNLTQHYQDFLSDIQPIIENREAINTLSPLCALCMRYLLIHAWRRMVLRHPLMPQNLLPPKWPGISCHDELCAIYPKLVEKSELWWDNPTSKAGGNLLKARFRSH